MDTKNEEDKKWFAGEIVKAHETVKSVNLELTGDEVYNHDKPPTQGIINTAIRAPLDSQLLQYAREKCQFSRNSEGYSREEARRSIGPKDITDEYEGLICARCGSHEIKVNLHQSAYPDAADDVIQRCTRCEHRKRLFS